MLETIEQQPVELERYDDKLVRRIVEQVIVMPDGSLTFRFKCGE